MKINKSKFKNGISLITLVITIVVIVILTGAIILSISNNNPINQASEAVLRNDITTMKEQYEVEYITALGKHNGNANLIEIGDFSNNLVPGKYADSLILTLNGIIIKEDNTFTEELKIVKETLGDTASKEIEISKEPDKSKSYVGYYADIDGDKTVDGIIYADLVTGAVGDGQWVNDKGNYTVPIISTTEAKNYYVSKESYEGKFGTKPVLSQISGSIGTDRFYVMALEDFNKGTNYNWYYSAYGKMSDYTTYTSQNFGTGKANTNAMITKWNNVGYGTKDAGISYKDVWGIIQTEVGKGWYIPSREEWAAFGGEIVEKLGITTSNYGNFGLSDWYWSSSQINIYGAWCVYFDIGYMGDFAANDYTYARLATTF